jgi:cell division ATPase FtsA
MKIIDNDYLQAFISKNTYDGINTKSFSISFIIQINGKIKTTYADIETMSAEEYNKKHKENKNVVEVRNSNYIIDKQFELNYVINTLHNL